MTKTNALISTLVLFISATSANAMSVDVAEPSSVGLISAGLVGLFAARKHMKSKAS